MAKIGFHPHGIVIPTPEGDVVLIAGDNMTILPSGDVATFSVQIPPLPIIIGTITGSTIAGFDASSNLISLPTSTYPSLTELSYVKGVTSAIQTQLNARVTSVTGTTNRITSTGGATPAIDISASYVGQASITTVGTIGSGTWSGSFGAVSGANLTNLTAANIATGTAAINITGAATGLITLGATAFDYGSTTAVKIGTTRNNGKKFIPLYITFDVEAASAPTGVGSATMGVGVTSPNYNETMFTFLDATFNAVGLFYNKFLPASATAQGRA